MWPCSCVNKDSNVKAKARSRRQGQSRKVLALRPRPSINIAGLMLPTESDDKLDRQLLLLDPVQIHLFVCCLSKVSQLTEP
jgi:hypothetical protein